MQAIEDKELKRIRELLNRTSEFIAYFELVESKMIEWQKTIEQKTNRLLAHYLEEREALQKELESLDNILSQAGLSEFKQSMLEALSQGEKHRHALHEKGEDVIKKMDLTLEHFNHFAQKSLQSIEEHTNKAISEFSLKLSEYDPQLFHRIADESCLSIERFARDAVGKNKRFLNSFQWKAIFLTVLTTLLTTFIIGLYISDEMPWETHQQAMNERQAGRVLLKAWPKLSQQEKYKLLQNDTHQDG